MLSIPLSIQMVQRIVRMSPISHALEILIPNNLRLSFGHTVDAASHPQRGTVLWSLRSRKRVKRRAKNFVKSFCNVNMSSLYGFAY